MTSWSFALCERGWEIRGCGFETENRDIERMKESWELCRCEPLSRLRHEEASHRVILSNITSYGNTVVSGGVEGTKESNQRRFKRAGCKRRTTRIATRISALTKQPRRSRSRERMPINEQLIVRSRAVSGRRSTERRAATDKTVVSGGQRCS